MSWPRQVTPQQDHVLQDEAARRMLEDASQQLASGNPAQSLQTVLSLLSALHLPEEAAAAAIKVQEAMAQDPSRDVTAQLASLLGSLNLSTRESDNTTSKGLPFPPPPQMMIPLSLQNEFSNLQHHDTGLDIEMENIEDATEQPLRGNNVSLSTIRAAAVPDGEASYLCSRCQLVISVARKAAHDETWCPALQRQLPP